MPTASDLRTGHLIELDGELWKILDASHHSATGQCGVVRVSLRNVRTGADARRELPGTEKVAKAFVETREFRYLYRDGDLHVFTDDETCGQISLDAELVGDAPKYVPEGGSVVVELHGTTPVGVRLPGHVVLRVTGTAPGSDGVTDATLETGHVLRVPPHVEAGESVRVDTRTGEYVEAA